jgi:hypothetical protein
MKTATRPIALLILTLVVAALSPTVAVASRPAAVPARAYGEVTFSIGEGVSPEDEMLIREGVRLAQDFLADELGVEVQERTIVNARATASDDDPLVGMAGMNWVGLYTSSAGWLQSPPAHRLHVVVHEFVHVMQREQLGGPTLATATWLDEGLAEYLSFRALERLDLMEWADVDAYHAYGLTYGPWLPGLADLESYEGYNSQDATVYALAYFAARELVAELELDRVVDYYAAIGDGADWARAFAEAFEVEPAVFYEAFAPVRAAIAAPGDLPPSFWPVEPRGLSAEVWPVPAEGPVERGDQALFAAQTDPEASCTLVVTSPAGQPVLDLPAYADAEGLVFWLWTVPAETNRGTARATMTCGGEPAVSKLKVA